MWVGRLVGGVTLCFLGKKGLVPSTGNIQSLKIELPRVKRLVEVDWSEEDL